MKHDQPSNFRVSYFQRHTHMRNMRIFGIHGDWGTHICFFPILKPAQFLRFSGARLCPLFLLRIFRPMGSGASHGSDRHRLDRLDLLDAQETSDASVTASDGEPLELFDRVGPEVFGARSWGIEAQRSTTPNKPWIYTRVKAYNAEEWAARFGVGGVPFFGQVTASCRICRGLDPHRLRKRIGSAEVLGLPQVKQRRRQMFRSQQTTVRRSRRVKRDKMHCQPLNPIQYELREDRCQNRRALAVTFWAGCVTYALVIRHSYGKSSVLRCR